MSEIPPASSNLPPGALGPAAEWGGIVQELNNPDFVASPAPSTIEEYAAGRPGTDLVPYTANRLGEPSAEPEIVDAEIVDPPLTRAAREPLIADAEIVEPAPPAQEAEAIAASVAADNMAAAARHALVRAHGGTAPGNQIAVIPGRGNRQPPQPTENLGFIGPARPPVVYTPSPRGAYRRRPYGEDPHTDLMLIPLNQTRLIPDPEAGRINPEDSPRALNPGGTHVEFYNNVPGLEDIPPIRNATTKGVPFWGVSRPQRHGQGYEQMHWEGHHSQPTRAQRLGFTLNPFTWFDRRGRRRLINPDNGDLRLDQNGKRVPPTGPVVKSYIYK